MEWDTPEFTEIRMDSEVSAYQGDETERVTPEEPATSIEPPSSTAH